MDSSSSKPTSKSNGGGGGGGGGDDDAKSRGWPKGKKRYPKLPGAPRQPLSGYVHFLNEKRDEAKKENPELSFIDLSKKLAAEWTALPAEEKQKYNEVAEKDKERYAKEMAEYKLSDDYKKYVEMQAAAAAAAAENGDEPPNKKSKMKKAASANATAGAAPAANATAQVKEDLTGPTIDSGSGRGGKSVPIFTDEFLQLNKAKDAELKQLRKSVTELEETNAILAKHVDTMRTAIGKLEAETAQQTDQNASMQRHIDALRKMVVAAFRGAQGIDQAVTVDNVDAFMKRVQGMLASGENAPMLNKVREVVVRMEPPFSY